MRTLTIISHTEHYKRPDGTLVGLGSTVTEINHLLEVFDAIIHVAMLHDTPAPPSALPYTSTKITFVALPAVGGIPIWDKLRVLCAAPKIVGIINKSISKSTYFQFRAPTGIGVYVIPYLICFSSRKGWFKYAGNWKQEQAPLAYKFQKWLLKKQSRKVTINGFWDAQPKQCLSFENPCLTQEEVESGQFIRANKTFQQPLQFCFVGRLEAAKGMDLIIDAIESLDAENRSKIGTIHLVGDGLLKANYQKKAKDLHLPFVFHGYLSRAEVHDIYKKSHAILLPSASEGFPKVIAEAMNYGCIPIVSDVSSIGHYVKAGHNGFLLNSLSVDSLLQEIEKVLKLSNATFSTMIQTENNNISKFTYTYYNIRIAEELINNESFLD
jgi:glycosyltransferase involved in cell wall biosynthesis